MAKTVPKIYCELLDIKKILARLDKDDDLKIILRKTKQKGVGVYAIKPIKKNETISYYKLTVFEHEKYTSPTGYMYAADIYRKNGNDYKKYIGDITIKSIPDPLNDIPFWGLFTNEPSKGQVSNAEMDMNLDFNYKNRNTVKPGSTMIYEIIATKPIKKGEEIVWHYGDDYIRDYEVGK